MERTVEQLLEVADAYMSTDDEWTSNMLQNTFRLALQTARRQYNDDEFATIVDKLTTLLTEKYGRTL